MWYGPGIPISAVRQVGTPMGTAYMICHRLWWHCESSATCGKSPVTVTETPSEVVVNPRSSVATAVRGVIPLTLGEPELRQHPARLKFPADRHWHKSRRKQWFHPDHWPWHEQARSSAPSTPRHCPDYQSKLAEDSPPGSCRSQKNLNPRGCRRRRRGFGTNRWWRGSNRHHNLSPNPEGWPCQSKCCWHKIPRGQFRHHHPRPPPPAGLKNLREQGKEARWNHLLSPADHPPSLPPGRGC